METFLNDLIPLRKDEYKPLYAQISDALIDYIKRCEEKCEKRKEDNQPVHIRALKRYLADSRPDISFEPGPLSKETGKKVAIVGSGPAGLMAAYELAVKGHAVTVFDSATEPGGRLRFGIPAFRLPGVETAQAVRMLERVKVVFQTGRTLGRELDIKKLEREWDGLLLATGGGPALRLKVPGEDLPGVCQGLDLLRLAREGQTPKIGRSVLIIGGGNTAVDAAERCLNCGRPGEFNQTCWSCLPCEIECPVDALEVRIPYLVR